MHPYKLRLHLRLMYGRRMDCRMLLICSESRSAARSLALSRLLQFALPACRNNTSYVLRSMLEVYKKQCCKRSQQSSVRM